MSESPAADHPVAFRRGPGGGEPMGTEQKVLLSLILIAGAYSSITLVVWPEPWMDRSGPLVFYFTFVVALDLLGERVRGSTAAVRLLGLIQAWAFWVLAVHVSVLIAVGPAEKLWFAVLAYAVGAAVLGTFPISDRWAARIWASIGAVWLAVLLWAVVGWL